MKGFTIAALLTAGATAVQPSNSNSNHKLAPRQAEPTCQTDLSGPYEFPHLIIPVDATAPDTAPGTSYYGTVNENVTTLYNFNILADDTLPRCTLVYLFPSTDQVPANSYVFEGDGAVSFGLLDEVVTEETTYNSRPGVATDYGTQTLEAGNAYTIADFDCPQGYALSVEMANAGTTNLEYFQDYGANPFGLFITRCAPEE